MWPFVLSESGWVASSEEAKFPKRHQLPLNEMQIT